MIFTILLSYFTGILILYLSKQNKYLNIFEIIGFGFGIGISLFVFEMLIQNILFGQINLLLPILSFIVLFLTFLFKNYKNKSILEGSFINSIKKSFLNISLWKKILLFLFILISFGKIGLSLSTNIIHPTIGEDAVTGWDLKTKVFFENKEIILDKTNPENLGGEPKRSVAAPLSDLFFILTYKEIPIWGLNIFSWLIYFNMYILLFGIFFRKFDIFIASLAGYVWVSIPFIYIHSIESYFNMISGFFLFIFTFYISDQIIKKKEKNFKILIPLGILIFLDSSIRSESLLLVSIILIFDLLILFINQKMKAVNFYRFIPIFLGIGLSWIINKYYHSFSGFDNILTDGFDIFSIDSIKQLIENVFNGNLFGAVFSQALFHPDYNLLYLGFILSLILIIFNKKLFKEINIMIYKIFILLGIFIGILFMVPQFGLLTHFAFIRYSLPITPFIIYILVYTIGYTLKEKCK